MQEALILLCCVSVPSTECGGIPGRGSLWSCIDRPQGNCELPFPDFQVLDSSIWNKTLLTYVSAWWVFFVSVFLLLFNFLGLWCLRHFFFLKKKTQSCNYNMTLSYNTVFCHLHYKVYYYIGWQQMVIILRVEIICWGYVQFESGWKWASYAFFSPRIANKSRKMIIFLGKKSFTAVRTSLNFVW